MKVNVTTWNVNSIRRRLQAVLRYLESEQPDILCLQETKCTEDEFPWIDFVSRGYVVSVAGQHTYNGVAIVSRLAQIDVDQNPVPAALDEARSLKATIQGVRVLNVYVPYGKAVGTAQFKGKLRWLDSLQTILAIEDKRPQIICGDFNVAPDDRDVYDPRTRREKLICSTPERERFSQLLRKEGYVDAFRTLCHEAGHYTWWSHRRNAFARNRGLRVDHHLVDGSLADSIQSVEIDVKERGLPGASDHARVTLIVDTEG